MTLKKHNTPSNNKPRANYNHIKMDVHFFVCVALLVLGTVVRLYNLGGESIDLEEYACVSALGAPDFASFFEEQRDLYPYGAPLTPTFLYFWAKIAGQSITAIRLFVALIGILVMVMGYVTTTLFFRDSTHSRKAALLVLLCIAMSPVHVFHSQEARMYALVSLFTLAGMATFLQGLRTSSPLWWTLHLAANVSLIACHYFAIFLLPVYGLILLLWDRRPTFRIFFWGIGHCFLVVVLLLWVAAIPKQAEELYSYYEMPSVYNVLIHTIAGDSTTLSATSFFPSMLAWGFLPQSLQNRVLESHLFFDILLLLTSITGLCGGLLFLLRGIRGHDINNALHWALLLLWAVLPVLLIVILSLIWRPIYGSRYVMYSMFAFYLLIGGIAAHLPKKLPYVCCVVLIALVYGYQLSIALPPQTRTAWRQAYEQVQNESNDNALLLLEDPFFKQVLEINIKGEPPVPIVAAFNRSTLCDAVSVLIHADNKKNTDIWVLLVLTTDFNESMFADCLRASQLAYERTYYPGERNLALYHILPITDTHTENNITVFKPFVNVIPEKREQLSPIITAKELKYLSDEDGGFWIRLGIVTALYQQKEFANAAFYKTAQTSLHAALRLAVLADDLQCPLDSNQLASFALHAPDMEPCEALHAFMQTAYYTNNVSFVEALGNITPDCRESCIYRGIAAYKKEAYREAASFFSRYENLASTTPPEIIEAYAIALTETEQYEQAADLLQTGIELHPAYKWLYMRLGIVKAALGDHNAAVPALRVALDHAPDNAYILYLLINSLVALKGYEEAALLANNPVLLAEQDSWVLWARWRAFTGAGQDDAGRNVFEKLATIMPELHPFYQSYYVEANPARIRELIDQLDDEDAQQIFPEAFMLLDRLK